MSLASPQTHSVPGIVQPPVIAFPASDAPTPDALRRLPCPNCGSGDDKTLVVSVDVQLPDNPPRHLNVLRCHACTASFYDSQLPPDYAEPALNDRGRVPFYVQQGAGVSLITRPLAQLRHGPGAAYMEVGCGFGFGLDFALKTRGWSGVGIDPAPLAALGRDALRLPIELRYLRDDDEARGTIDVVMGSEVIEHVPSPASFVRTLRAMLKPGGVLILTTPNGDDVAPTTPPGIIIPLLSPSLHLVLQTRRSLHALLHQAGFAHIDVSIDSHSLVAFASDAPLTLEREPGPLRQALRGHLEARAREADAASDLRLAFAGRAFTESVNDGDFPAAARAWDLLAPAVQDRFHIDLAAPALPPVVSTCGLEEMARLVPLNLAGLLYGRGIVLLSGGAGRAGLEALFLLAAEAAAGMRRALGELAMEDGQTEDIGWTAQSEALLCAADAGASGLPARFVALSAAPNGGMARRGTIGLRAFVHLVNAGHYEAARDFRDQAGVLRLLPAADAPLADAERDAVFCLAVLDVQPGGDVSTALRRFARVQAGTPPGSDLWTAALRGELQGMDALGEQARARTLLSLTMRQHPHVALPPDVLARVAA